MNRTDLHISNTGDVEGVLEAEVVVEVEAEAKALIDLT